MTTPPEATHLTTVADALRALAAAGVPRVDAHLLLLGCLGRDPHDRAWLLTHDDTPLEAATARRLAALQARRLAGEPMAYLLGQREFHGLTLAVDARVLDPRPDTETLVDWALEVLDGRPTPSVADLGTGSGAIALALAARRPDASVLAVDRSRDALAVAQGNATRLGLAVAFRQGDWYAALDSGARFDALVSNPPYIAEGDPHLGALVHEPRQALVSGPDGLDDLRRLVAGAPAHLRPGGWLLLEHGWDQAEVVRTLLAQAGFSEVHSRHDLAGIERCSGGRWLADASSASGSVTPAGDEPPACTPVGTK